MQAHPHRRRAIAWRLLLAAAAFSLATFLLHYFDSVASTATSARPIIVPPRRRPVSTLRAIKAITIPDSGGQSPVEVEQAPAAILLPDWEVLVLLHPADQGIGSSNATCAFPGGSSSPARALGRLPSSSSSSGGRLAYTCVMPRPVRRRQPFPAPRLITGDADQVDSGSVEMLRWRGRLVYHAVALDGGDVLVFAKGVNQRQGVNRKDVRCVYYGINDGVQLGAVTSAQQVFRCPPPPSLSSSSSASAEVRVTLAVAGEDPVPSMATYSRPAAIPSPSNEKKVTICACTMVRDVAKFLREWVVYHAAVGVDRFFLYDNGSGDDLADQVGQLRSAGYDVSVQAWPWPKTQEAGFSYAAAAHRDSCEWMAFIDVDEFIVSPSWAKSRKPTPRMLRSLVAAVDPDVGQVTLGCKDFGPSGRTMHPQEGVTQGYTCRRRGEERHKSLVRLDAVHPSLLNSVHHFELRPEFRWERSGRARVNHYKYQAWDEFKVKFRRRVSTYVADWTDTVNPGSKDRTPGLGFSPVEPAGWPHKFCEVEDTLLRDLTRKWFGVGFTNNQLPPPHTTSSSS
ncbi:hypothetical protein EJB05_40901, partial [Eragrostis curvula]